MVICPNCDHGKVTSLQCPGAKVVTITCNYCNGSGEITDEQLYAIRVGSQARTDRVRRGLSQREEAARLGWDVVELSHFENGRSFKPPSGV